MKCLMSSSMADASFQLLKFSALKTPDVLKARKNSKNAESDTRDVRSIANSVNKKINNMTDSDDSQSLFLTQPFKEKKSPKKKKMRSDSKDEDKLTAVKRKAEIMEEGSSDSGSSVLTTSEDDNDDDSTNTSKMSKKTSPKKIGRPSKSPEKKFQPEKELKNNGKSESDDCVSDSEEDIPKTVANTVRKPAHDLSSSSVSSDSSLSDSDSDVEQQTTKSVSKKALHGSVNNVSDKNNESEIQKENHESDRESVIIPVSPKVLYKPRHDDKTAEIEGKRLYSNSTETTSEFKSPSKRSKVSMLLSSKTEMPSPQKQVSWAIKEEAASTSESDQTEGDREVFFSPSESLWNPKRYKLAQNFEVKSSSSLVSNSQLEGKQLFLIRTPAKFDINTLHNKVLPLDGQSCFITNEQTEKQYEATVLMEPSAQAGKLRSIVAGQDSDRLSIGPGFCGQVLVMDWVPTIPSITLQPPGLVSHTIPEGLKPTFKPFGSESPKRVLHEKTETEIDYDVKKKKCK